MANKHFSDVRANRGDKDSSKESLRGPARGKPAVDPSMSSFKPNSGKVTNQGPSGKGGKDLPSPKFVEKQNRSNEACGELPKGI